LIKLAADAALLRSLGFSFTPFLSRPSACAASFFIEEFGLVPRQERAFGGLNARKFFLRTVLNK